MAPQLSLVITPARHKSSEIHYYWLHEFNDIRQHKLRQKITNYESSGPNDV